MSSKTVTQEILTRAGFNSVHITRAFGVYEKNYGYRYNVACIAEIIVRLQDQDHSKFNPPLNIQISKSQNNHSPFRSHMSRVEASRLKVNDKVDHRTYGGRFVLATIQDKQGSKLKIRYDGLPAIYDTWSDYEPELHRFAKAGSISRRPAHRFKNLKVGDWIHINPIRHPGWKPALIRCFDSKSGQIKV